MIGTISTSEVNLALSGKSKMDHDELVYTPNITIIVVLYENEEKKKKRDSLRFPLDRPKWRSSEQRCFSRRGSTREWRTSTAGISMREMAIFDEPRLKWAQNRGFT